MKQILVDSNLGCCHGNAFVKAKFPVFRKKWPFSRVFISAFLVQIRNQLLKIDPCAKFQPDWTKDKGSSKFDLERYRKLLDDVIPIS